MPLLVGSSQDAMPAMEQLGGISANRVARSCGEVLSEFFFMPAAWLTLLIQLRDAYHYAKQCGLEGCLIGGDFFGKVFEIVRDNHIGPATDGGCQNVPVL